MNAFRVARAARPAFNTLRAVQRRGYADVAADKIQLSLALPHQAIYKSQDVTQVNIPAESGEMGILASHVPAIEQLKPGLVEIIEEAGGSKQFFLSGGFATVQPGSKLSINAVEGYALEDFSAEAVKNQIAEAQKIAGGSGSEQDIAEAKIELEVLESLQAVLNLFPIIDTTNRSIPAVPSPSYYTSRCTDLTILDVRRVSLSSTAPCEGMSETFTRKLRKKLSRLATKSSRVTLNNTTFAGSRTSRIFVVTPTPPSEHGSPEDLTRQISSASISADPATAGNNPYGNKPAERAGSSTRSIFHFTGHAPRWESEDDQSSAGHTPYMNGTPRTQSRVALFTPMLTPKTEPEGMSWESDPIRSPQPPQPQKTLHGILKQKGSKQELATTHTDHNPELRHQPSVCEKCNQEICAMTPPAVSTKLWLPATMQDPGVSEALARLEAERMAAEVEALHPKPPSLTPSGSSSEKSASSSAGSKREAPPRSWKEIANVPVTVDQEVVSSSIPETSPLPAPVISTPYSQAVAEPPTTRQNMRNRAANALQVLSARRDSFSTGALPQTSATQPALGQTPMSQSTSRFHEDIPGSGSVQYHNPASSNAITATVAHGFCVSRQFGAGERCLHTNPSAGKDTRATSASPSLVSSNQSSFDLDGASETEDKAQQSTVEKRRPSQAKTVGQVANRVRELELKSAIPMPRHFQPSGHYRHMSKNAHARLEKSTVDLIFPLHVHRFPHRSSDGTPHRPETPIHRSVPDDQAYIHSPQPSRSMPMLKDPPEPEVKPEPRAKSPTGHEDTATTSNSDNPTNKPSVVRPTVLGMAAVRKLHSASAQARVQPGIWLSAVEVLEATSPWSFVDRAKRSHAEYVCPDCAAEQALKRRETAIERDETLHAASRYHGGAPSLPTAASSKLPKRDTPLTTETYLPNNTNAIVVVQHEGTLDRVVTDPRKGPLTRDSSRRLSDNLAKVSKAVAELGSVVEDAAVANAHSRPSSGLQTKKPSTMTELLQHLHTIAGEMSIDLSKVDQDGSPTREQRSSLSRQSLFRSEDLDDLLTEPTSPGPSSDAALAAAIASRKDSQITIQPAQSPPSTYATAQSTRKHSLQSPISLPSSVLRAADYAPSTSTPVSNRPASRLMRSPSAQTPLNVPPGHYPFSPGPVLPWLAKAPEAVKRVRVTSNRWPPQQDSQLSARQLEEVEGVKKDDLQKAVQEAAEIERGLRRRIRTHDGLSGAYKGRNRG
ncbi:hypothetical protein Q7P37_006928 [Cladosporium fusiforme]